MNFIEAVKCMEKGKLVQTSNERKNTRKSYWEYFGYDPNKKIFYHEISSFDEYGNLHYSRMETTFSLKCFLAKNWTGLPEKHLEALNKAKSKAIPIHRKEIEP